MFVDILSYTALVVILFGVACICSIMFNLVKVAIEFLNDALRKQVIMNKVKYVLQIIIKVLDLVLKIAKLIFENIANVIRKVK